MARAVYPIIKLGRPAEWGFDLALEDLMEGVGRKVDDQFTYTTRYQFDPETDETLIEEVKRRIRTELDMDPAEAERFISFMDEHDWDVSFLVDCY